MIFRDEYGNVIGSRSESPNYLGEYVYRDSYGNVVGTRDSQPNYLGEYHYRDIYGNPSGYASDCDDNDF